MGGRYKPVNGGNAKRISTMCEAFHLLGNKVVVMTCDSTNYSGSCEMINGIKVYRYKCCDDLIRSMVTVLANDKCDVVLVHEETYLRKLRWMRISLPIVYECHAIEENASKTKEFILKFIRKLYFNKTFIKRVFVLSQNAKKLFNNCVRYPEDLILYTPNGIEKNNVEDIEMHFSENDKFVYGYAGTLYDFQGINILLEYAKEILNIAADVQISIVGGGPLENDVRCFVKENRLESRIFLTGAVPQNEFDKYVDGFDVMVMPRPSTSSTESAVPLKVFDAAYHRKPVIMSNVSGLTEAFSADAALIYDTKEPSGLVECCKKIYRNKELAESLVRGEVKAFKAWPTVIDVAKMQLEAMNGAINEVR